MQEYNRVRRARALRNRCGIALAFLLPTIAASEASAQIEEIVVTALKRQDSIQDVPISITAISGTFIENAGIDDIRDLTLYTPNFFVTTQNSIGNTQFVMRGVGSDGNSGIEPSVGVYVDGVYIPRSASMLNSLLDIQTFEVLRGPQGTLFGRNTPMGALNINTRAPSEEFESFFELTAGNEQIRESKGYISGPLAENLTGRLSFVINDRSGFTRNVIEGGDTNDSKEYSGRVKLLWQPGDDFDISLIADYARIDGSLGDEEFLNLTPGFVSTVEALSGVTVTDTKLDHVIENSVNNDRGWDENFGFNVTANLDIGSHTLTSITSYRDWENVIEGETLNLPIPMLELRRPQGTETFSQEVRILSPGGQRFDYVAGVFYYHEEYELQDLFTALPNLCLLRRFQSPPGVGGSNPARIAACPIDSADLAPDFRADFNTNLDSVALFGQGTLNITDDLSLTAGVRWTRDDKEGSYIATTAVTTDFIQPANFFGDRVDKQTNWLINGRYSVTDEAMFFFSVSTGFKSGGFNGRTNATQREFGPEKTTDYEVGVKSTLLDGRLLANVTLYRTNLENFQDSVSLSTGLAFNVQNAGELRVQGVEADFQFNPIDQLTIIASGAYLDSKFLDFVGASVPSGFGFGDLPTIIRRDDGSLVQDLTGSRRQSSPRWQSSVSSTWTDKLPGFDGMEWFLSMDWSYMGEHFLLGNLDPGSLEPKRSVFGLRAGISSEDDRWKFTAWSQNLTDKQFCISRFNQPLGGLFGGGQVLRCNLGDPLTFGGTLTLRL